MLRKIYSPFERIEYVENSDVTVDIPRGKLLRGILLKVRGALDVAAGVAATAIEDNPWSIVKRIQVVVDGSQIVKDLDAIGYRWWNTCFDFKGSDTFEFDDITDAEIAGLGVLPFYCFIWIPFVMPGTRVPIDTLFDTRLSDTLQLRISWGDIEDIATADANITWDTEPWIDPVSVETTQPSNRIFSLLKEFFIEKSVDAVATEFPIDIPRGNWSYRAFMMRELEDGVRSDGILNNVSLVSQQSFFAMSRLPAAHLRALGDIEEMATNQPTGIHIVETIEDGMLSSSTPTGALTDYRFKLDVNVPGADNRILMYCRQVIPADVKLSRGLASQERFRVPSIV